VETYGDTVPTLLPDARLVRLHRRALPRAQERPRRPSTRDRARRSRRPDVRAVLRGTRSRCSTRAERPLRRPQPPAPAHAETAGRR
jgi:hypothetical protein